MRRSLIWLLTLASALPGAVVIDRIAVVVDKHPIKSSDIRRDLRLTEFMNREPVDLSAAAMRKAAERLIDQTLIRSEIARGGFRRPSDADADTLLSHVVRDRFGGSDSRLREALSRYNLTEDELREQFLWELTVLRFIDQRFRPGVQVADEDTRTEGERINQAFAAWLEDARKQVRIEYREGAFE
jgi:peptidyl-prolyl cis-trans isomerase SurA